MKWDAPLFDLQWAQDTGLLGANASTNPSVITAIALGALCGGVIMLFHAFFNFLRAGEHTVRDLSGAPVTAGGFAHKGESNGETLGVPGVNRRARRIYTPLDAQHDMLRWVIQGMERVTCPDPSCVLVRCRTTIMSVIPMYTTVR